MYNMKQETQRCKRRDFWFLCGAEAGKGENFKVELLKVKIYIANVFQRRRNNWADNK